MSTQLKKKSVEELVELFVELSREQHEFMIDGPPSKYNRLYKRVREIAAELQSRPGDQRMALHPLLAHPKLQVKMNAAYILLDIARDDAFATLKWVAESRYTPFNAHAAWTVDAIEENDFPRGSNPNSRFRRGLPDA
ncbi:MAG: DUF2019 domain-containing protein [Rhizobiaceae bacterium]